MRRSYLRRGKRLERKTGLKSVNRKRKAERLLCNFGPPEFRAFSKSQPCVFCGVAPRQWPLRDYWGNDMAHVRDRGMGGCNSSWRLVVPACPDCHDADKPRGQYALAREHQRRWRASHYYMLSQRWEAA